VAHGVAAVVRLVVGSGRRWKKKKKQRPAKEKGSSRLELLEWLRRELLPWLPLGRKRASRQGGSCSFCCCRYYLLDKVVVVPSAVVAAVGVTVVEKMIFTEERERSGATTM